MKTTNMTKKKAKKPTNKTPKKPDVRGYIIRPEHPEDYGYVEKGHLEGKDALSAVPPDTLELIRRAFKSKTAKITVRRVK
jgi:hypothetical protein